MALIYQSAPVVATSVLPSFDALTVPPLGTTAIFRPIRSSGGFADFDLPAFRLVERYALQSAARSVLGDRRVSKCLRVPTSHEVFVNKTTATGKFNFVNLQTCGSVWHCPCCAAKISERRKSELTRAIAAHTKTGGVVYLLTLTLPHRADHTLKSVLAGLDSAYEAFRKDRAYRDHFIPESGLVGVIKALEVTYGANGWHPHLHVLLFCKIPLSKLSCHEDNLLSIWKKVVHKKGFGWVNLHGLTLQNGKYAAKYVSKWSLENELTKGHIKKSRSGFTPFDLLRVIVGIPTASEIPMEPEQARILFAEYGKAFHGKRQLRASPGLYRLLGMEPEKTDEEIADSNDEKTTVFYRISLEVWKAVLAGNKRGELLNVCSQGVEVLEEFLIDVLMEHGVCFGC